MLLAWEAYGDLKHLNRTTASDKILCDKEFNVAKYVKYDGYQRGLLLSSKHSPWWRRL